MKITTEQLEAHVKTLIVEIAKSDYEQEFEEQMRKTRRGMNLKGFRPGQVPMGLARKMVGAEVRMRVVQEKLDKGVGEYLEENKYLTFTRLLTNEKQAKFDIEQDEDFEFRLDIGIVPECPIDKSMAITQLVPTPDDTYVAEQLENNRIFYGELRGGDSITATSVVRGKFEAVNPQGEALESQPIEGLPVFSMKDVAEDPKSLFLEKKLGDTIEIENLSDVMATPERLKALFHVADTEDEKLKGHFRMTVKEIKEQALAPLNKELYGHFLDMPKGVEMPEDPAELSKLYMEQLMQQGRYRGLFAAGNELFNKLIAGWDFNVSHDFLTRALKGDDELTPTSEELDAVMEQIKRDCLGHLLFLNVDKTLLETPELEARRKYFISMIIAHKLSTMGLPSHFFQSVERTLQFGGSLLRNEEDLQELNSSEHRAIGITEALKQVTVTEQEVPLGELDKLIDERYTAQKERAKASEEKK